jgi:hypothetical protein
MAKQRNKVVVIRNNETTTGSFLKHTHFQDGHIDFREFMIVLYIMSNGSPEENLKQIFRVFDINNDGTITLKVSAARSPCCLLLTSNIAVYTVLILGASKDSQRSFLVDQ